MQNKQTMDGLIEIPNNGHSPPQQSDLN